MKLRRSIVGSLVFLLVTGAIGTLLVAALLGTPPGPNSYAAVFTDATQLKPGDDVKAAGVSVGKVGAITLNPDYTVNVAFSTSDAVHMTSGTQVTIKYRNLVGDRFLALTQGARGAAPLAPGAVIPLANTAPALDLDELYNGFAPLLQGLAPEQINRLSSSLVQILQGEGGSIEQLLSTIGSLTNTLADRDRTIGRLIDNLNTVLGTLNANSDKVGSLVDNLSTLISGLSRDRERIGSSLQGIDALTSSVSGLLQDARPEIKGLVHQVDRVSTVLNADEPNVEYDLSRLPAYYQVLGRVGAYQSAFQFYLCGVQLRIVSPTGQTIQTPMISSEVARCQY